MFNQYYEIINPDIYHIHILIWLDVCSVNMINCFKEILLSTGRSRWPMLTEAKGRIYASVN